jgi:uncharacterized protein YkwD
VKRKQWYLVVAGLVLVGFIAGFGGTYVYSEYVDTPSEDFDAETVEAEVLERIDEVRLEENRSRLNHSHPLSTAAGSHSRDMAEREFVGHENPYGKTPRDRVSTHSIECVDVGENVAQTWWDEPLETDDGRLTSNAEVAEWLVAAWLESPRHRANLLDRKWTKTGVGVVIDDGKVFATQLFCS